MMKKMMLCYVAFIFAFVVSAKTLPSSWPLVGRIQERMPRDVTTFFSFKNMYRMWRADPDGMKYLVVGECNAWNFPGDVPRLAMGNEKGALKRIEKKIKMATLFKARNVAVFWGIGNVGRNESKAEVEAEIASLVQVIHETYPYAKITVVSPYDVLDVTGLGPAYRKKVVTHLSDPVGYNELIRRIPELEDFVVGKRRELLPKPNSGENHSAAHNVEGSTERNAGTGMLGLNATK